MKLVCATVSVDYFINNSNSLMHRHFFIVDSHYIFTEITAKLTSKQALLNQMRVQQQQRHSNEILFNGAWHSIFSIVCLSN